MLDAISFYEISMRKRAAAMAQESLENGERMHSEGALDTMLDVQPAAMPAETRAAVMKAMVGHVRGKAVYVGLFRLPAQQ